jgi:hypothetical protein
MVPTVRQIFTLLSKSAREVTLAGTTEIDPEPDLLWRHVVDRVDFIALFQGY